MVVQIGIEIEISIQFTEIMTYYQRRVAYLLLLVISVALCRISMQSQIQIPLQEDPNMNSQKNALLKQSPILNQKITSSKCCNKQQKIQEEEKESQSEPCPRQAQKNRNRVKNQQESGNSVKLASIRESYSNSGAQKLGTYQVNNVLLQLYAYAPKSKPQSNIAIKSQQSPCCQKPSTEETTPIPIPVPSPVPTPVSLPAPIPIIGGFQAVSDPKNDAGASKALSFLQKTIGQQVQKIKNLQVYSQLVNGINYKFIFEFLYLERIVFKYEAVVYAKRDGTFELTSAKILDPPAFDSDKLKKFASIKDSVEISQIEALLRKLYPDNMADLLDITQVYAYEPYFVLTFNNKQKTITKVTLIFDPVILDIEVVKVSQQVITTYTETKPAVVTKVQPQPIIPSIIPAVISTPTLSVTETGKQVPVLPVETKPITPPVTTKPAPILVSPPAPAPLPIPITDAKPVVNPTPVIDPKPTVIIPSPPPITTSPVPIPIPPPSPPTRTPKPNPLPQSKISQYLDLTPPSKTNLPFYLQSYALEIDASKVEDLVKYVRKVKGYVDASLNVVLVNLVRYGARIVIQLPDLKKIAECVLTFNYKADDQTLNDIYLILYQQLKSLSDINPQPFTQYYPTSALNSQPQKQLLTKAFKNIPEIGQFRSLQKLSIKLTYEGLYYKIVVSSLNKHPYQVVLFWVPQGEYLQVMGFVAIDDQYNGQYQTEITRFPTLNDTNFTNAKNYTMNNIKNFGTDLRNSKIASLYSTMKSTTKYYRFVLEDVFRVETIVFVKNYCFFTKYQVLENGYLHTNDSFPTSADGKEVVAFARSYFLEKLGVETAPVHVLVRKIGSLRIDYKLLYNKYPMVVIISKQLSSQKLILKGVQKLPNPMGQYYTTALSGYYQMSPSQSSSDPIYPILLNLATTQNKLFQSSPQVLQTYKKYTSPKITYKIFYRLPSQLYLATFEYTYSDQSHKLISLQPYTRKFEEGDYRWGCADNDKKTQQCVRCQFMAALTLGRCYLKIVGCSVQIGNVCAMCANQYYFNTTDYCVLTRSLPALNATIEPEPVYRSGNYIRYATSPDIVSGCMVWDGTTCIGCQARKYTQNGFCVPVSPKCGDFNSLTGKCTTCAPQYYMNALKQCINLSSGCVSANEIGQCLSCQPTHDLLNGKCQAKATNIRAR